MTENLDQNMSHNQLQIGELTRNHLLTTAKWAHFLAILGFIGLAFMILGGLIAFAVMPPMAPTQMKYMPLVYLIMAIIYYFPTMYLFKFATNMKIATLSMNQNSSDDAFEYMKSLFKFMGIATIVLISLYILVVVIFVGFLSMM